MKKLVLFLLFISFVFSCSVDDEKELPFYVADNGVTIKARDWVPIGKKADLKGIVFGFNKKIENFFSFSTERKNDPHKED